MVCSAVAGLGEKLAQQPGRPYRLASMPREGTKNPTVPSHREDGTRQKCQQKGSQRHRHLSDTHCIQYTSQIILFKLQVTRGDECSILLFTEVVCIQSACSSHQTPAISVGMDQPEPGKRDWREGG